MLRNALLAGALLLAGCRAHTFVGTEFPGSPPAAEIELTAHTGEAFRLSDSKGKLTLLFFGYSKHERHQRAGAVACDAADNGCEQRNARDQRKLPERDISESGNHGAAR